MNDLLQLKGTFLQKKGENKPGAPLLPAGTEVSVNHLVKLKQDLEKTYKVWERRNLVEGAIVNVYYTKVIAKSRRISVLLAQGSKSPNESVVGAKFAEEPKHVITHYVSLDVLASTIDNLHKCIQILEGQYNGKMTYKMNEAINKGDTRYSKTHLSKTKFLQIVVDAFFVEKFSSEAENYELDEQSVVSIYKTELDAKALLDKLGINIISERILDETTVMLLKEEWNRLKENAPYMIAMATSDIAQITKDDVYGEKLHNETIHIPEPTNEPVIGVIDTLFDKRVYFADWVEYEKWIPDEMGEESGDFEHGTAVSSLVVDGPSLNPALDDGCGQFRVRHFGVAKASFFNSFSIVRDIKRIVKENRDIKVWNLSLGSINEVKQNFVSAEAAVLDELQYKYDVIFVVAGTNKRHNETEKRIGAPADSINSLVVNSVDSREQPTSYSRSGPVLSFFNKPDVSYYGGSKGEYITVCTPNGEVGVSGTSYAAPWISRKLAYMIEVLGFSREIAKALVIDSATTWQEDKRLSVLVGYGTVPIHIKDVISSPDDEIRFVLSAKSEKFDTYSYNIPVPTYKDKYPYIAKATLCYFPRCTRNQGVDYTNTEMDVYFGRLDTKGRIKTINDNHQSSGDGSHLLEAEARKDYRKWDNVKHIREYLKINARGKKIYTNKMWGISIKTKNRLQPKDGEGINFGVVVTLKEINGVNRIDEFIKQCSFRGWLVNKVNVENQIDVYNTAEEEIIFDDM